MECPVYPTSRAVSTLTTIAVTHDPMVTNTPFNTIPIDGLSEEETTEMLNLMKMVRLCVLYRVVEVLMISSNRC